MHLDYKKIIICLVAIVLFFPLIASALEVNYPPITILGKTLTISPGDSPAQYAAYFFNLLLGVGAFLALVVIAVGGANYLISFGRGKFTNEGKEWVRAGITGLIILFCAYLIAYTINPDLVNFKLDKIIPFQFPGINWGGGGSEPTTTIEYKEIPIGTLTENLLSKTMDCYEFDFNGDPIPMPMQDDQGRNIGGPTYSNHDRVDCLLKLMDAAQKKTDTISQLGQEIKKLMQTCTCAGKCNDPCNKDGKGCQVQGEGCGGACSQGAACEQPKDTESCCTPEVKNKVEHGPVEVGCNANNTAYNREASPSSIFNFFSVPTVFAAVCQSTDPSKPGYCSGAVGTCKNGVCVPLNNNPGGPTNTCCAPKKIYRGLDEFRTDLSGIANLIEENVQVNKQDVTVINIDGSQGVHTPRRWKDLKLVEQLAYYKEKIQQIEQAIKNDVKSLDTARSALANCYNVKSSVDFIKIKEEVKKEDKIVVVPKSSNSGADSSKYCKGFNYANSSCYNLCGKMCPDATKDVATCYKNCVKGECQPEDFGCLAKQQQCVKDCYIERPCTSAGGNNTPDNFGICIQGCQKNCSDLCSKAYLNCSDDYKFCMARCSNNSKCVFENSSTCLINPYAINAKDFENCINSNDAANTDYCIDYSYLCKYGSQEYAGYQDCTNGYTGCAPDSQKLTNPQYSSPYIFDHPQEQICPAPYEACKTGSNSGVSCVDLYPKAAKCPSNSTCPTCPCGEINQQIKFNIQNLNDSKKNTSVSVNLSAHDLVTGECIDYAYNTDPLTFYCRANFVPEQTPSGKNFECRSSDEIPVGQAVDDSKTWAKNLLKTTDDYLKSLEDIFKDIEKIKNKQQNQYCRCDSNYDSGKPICTTNCKYNPSGTATVTNPDGSTTTSSTPPSCAVVPCAGFSCQQMMDYLSKISDDFVNIKKAFVNTYIEFLKESRTDPLKELSYSRQEMNSCSRSMVKLGKDNVKTINCNIAYPSTGFLLKRCYGVLDGLVKTPSVDLTDNWFCCREANPSLPTNNNSKVFGGGEEFNNFGGGSSGGGGAGGEW